MLPLTTAIMCLSVLIYGEELSSPSACKVKTGLVVMTRVNDRRWPETVCAVVRDVKHGKQFSGINGEFYEQPEDLDNWFISQQIAKNILNGDQYENNHAVFFFNPKISKADAEKWREGKKLVDTCGDHEYYKSIEN